MIDGLTKEEILNKLLDDEHYYGAFGKQFRSNSDIKKLLEDPLSFGQPTPLTQPLVAGRYFHMNYLEKEKYDENPFMFSAAGSRNSKMYKEELKESGEELLLLTKEKWELDECLQLLEDHPVIKDLCRGDNIEYEVPFVGYPLNDEGEEDALIWKGKADIINHDERLIIDIKTTSDITRFTNSARLYNYDSQAFIYRQFAEQAYDTNGWEFIFVVVCKKSKRIGLYNCSEEFYGRGMQKVVQAIEVYKDMFLDPLFEKDKYLLSDTL